MIDVTRKEIDLLKKHDEQTYESIRIRFINLLKYFIMQEFDINAFDAEDIADESFIQAAYLKIDSYDPTKSSFQTWLFVIAKSRVIDYFRGEIHKIDYKSEFDVTRYPYVEKHYGIFDILKKILNDEEFRYIIFNIIYGIPIREIAILCNKSSANVYRILNVAKNKVYNHKEIFE